MQQIIVLGHKNPDTDSIVSAFVLAEILEKKPGIMPWFKGFKFKSGRAGGLNKETKFVFDYFKVSSPCLVKSVKNKNVILVDHNEFKQAVEGIEEANLMGIIDHHSLEGVKTNSPILYYNEPVGSTSTIITKIIFKNNIKINKKIAGLLLAAILSDTLKFTSPTTTEEDKKIAKELARISKEDIDSLSVKMFKAKSDISGISVKQIISQDYKEFKEGNKSFGVGVWETVDPSVLEEKKEEILTALDKFKRERKVDLIFFAIVDVLNRHSKMFLISEDEKKVAEKAFKRNSEDNLLFLPNIISRKKQMVPPLKDEIFNQ